MVEGVGGLDEDERCLEVQWGIVMILGMKLWVDML